MEMKNPTTLDQLLPIELVGDRKKMFDRIADRFGNEAADEWKEWRGIFQKRRKDKFLRYKEDRKNKQQESKNIVISTTSTEESKKKNDGGETQADGDSGDGGGDNICGGQWVFVEKEKEIIISDIADDDDDGEWEFVERDIAIKI